MRFFAFLIFPVVFAVSAAPPNLDPAQALDDLKSAIRSELAAHRGGMDESLVNLQSMLGELGNAVNADPREVERIINRIASMTTSGKIVELCDVYTKSLRARAEADEKALTESISAALQTASKALLSAKTASDLDAPLRELNRVLEKQNSRPNASAEDRALFSKAQNAVQTVQRWQDYLFELQAGNIEKAKEALRNLSANSGRDPGLDVPRSELLARMRSLDETAAPPAAKPQQNPVQDIFSRVKTLDDIRPALDEVAKLSQEKRSAQSNAVNAYETLAQNYAALKNGLPTNIATERGDRFYSDERLLRLRAELILMALPRYLNLSPDEKAKPGETVDAYLQRLIAAAREQKNWELFARVLSTQQSLARNPSTSYSIDNRDLINGLNTFLDGIKQERAKQYALAVFTFQSALKMGTQELPAEEIGQHLEKIKKEHPTEFEEGVERFLNPPARGDYPPGFPGSRTGPPSRPGGARAPGSSAPPGNVLAIPGSSPSPVAPAPNAPSDEASPAPATPLPSPQRSNPAAP